MLGALRPPLLEMCWKHSHRLVLREERCLHGWSKEEREEESRLQEESEPNVLCVT